MSRYCKTCNEEHELEKFYTRNKNHKLNDGTIKVYTEYRCKKIATVAVKLYVEYNQDKHNQYQKEYHEKNKEKHLIRYKKNGKIYRETNKIKIKEKNKKYNTENAERLSEIRTKRLQIYDNVIKEILTKKKRYNLKYDQPCDLDIDYIKLLMVNQNSKCIYCQHILEFKFNSLLLNQASIDRIDSNKFYNKDNIHLTCIYCNLAKTDSDDLLYKKFINTLRGEKYNFEYEEAKYKISRLTNSCKRFDIQKGYPSENSITSGQVKELLKKQNNKCAISGIEFINAKDHRFLFKVSIDRINNSQGHHYENCQLICVSINLGKSNKSNDAVIKYIQEISQLPPIPL